jgi:hypothetical protein
MLDLMDMVWVQSSSVQCYPDSQAQNNEVGVSSLSTNLWDVMAFQ